MPPSTPTLLYVLPPRTADIYVPFLEILGVYITNESITFSTYFFLWGYGENVLHNSWSEFIRSDAQLRNSLSSSSLHSFCKKLRLPPSSISGSPTFSRILSAHSFMNDWSIGFRYIVAIVFSIRRYNLFRLFLIFAPQIVYPTLVFELVGEGAVYGFGGEEFTHIRLLRIRFAE